MQKMVNGALGNPGVCAVSRVMVDLKLALELAQNQPQRMEEDNVLVVVLQQSPAM